MTDDTGFSEGAINANAYAAIARAEARALLWHRGQPTPPVVAPPPMAQEAHAEVRRDADRPTFAQRMAARRAARAEEATGAAH